MRILVTGAGGFVGVAVARAAGAAGHEVFGTVRPGGNVSRAAGLTTLPLDLRDAGAVRDVMASLRPEVLIHAAWSNVTAHRNGAMNFIGDVETACTLAAAGVAAGLQKFVGIGSQAEYGLRDAPDNEAPVGEDLLPEPRSAYGAAKLAALAMTRQICAAAGLPFAWLRLFATYGPGDNPSWLIPSLIDQMRAGTPPRTTAGVQRCDYLYIDDAADGILAAALHPAATGVLNLGSGIPLRVRDIAEAIRDRVAPGLALEFGGVPYGPGQVWHMQADIARLRATGWAPRIDFPTGLDRTMRPMGELVRFLFVGGLNALFGYAMFALGLLVGLPPAVALLFATVLGVLFNFMTTGRLVFGMSSRRLLPRFCLVYGIVYLANTLALNGLGRAGVSPFLAQAVLVPVSALGTFVLMKAFVFSERPA